MKVLLPHPRQMRKDRKFLFWRQLHQTCRLFLSLIGDQNLKDETSTSNYHAAYHTERFCFLASAFRSFTLTPQHHSPVEYCFASSEIDGHRSPKSHRLQVSILSFGCYAITMPPFRIKNLKAIPRFSDLLNLIYSLTHTEHSTSGLVVE